jgi:membrane associated rhomboid family serine protease
MSNAIETNKNILLRGTLFIPLLFVIGIWTVFLADNVLSLALNRFGILPRTIWGLVGIICSPFLHGNFNHIVSNTIPLFILMLLLKKFYGKYFWQVVVLGALLSGFGTWLIGSNNYHVGASGLIYALASFLFFEGIFSKRIKLILVSVIIVIFYGGMVWYMIPGTATIANNISWEGHLMGFAAGLLLSIFIKTTPTNN